MKETKAFPTALVYTVGTGISIYSGTFRPLVEVFAWIYSVNVEALSPYDILDLAPHVKSILSELYPEMFAIPFPGPKNKEGAEAFAAVLVERFGAELEVPRA